MTSQQNATHDSLGLLSEDSGSSDADGNKAPVTQSDNDTDVQENHLVVIVLALMSDLSSRSPSLQARLGSMDCCAVIVCALQYHKYCKKIVITGCTTISSLSSTIIATVSGVSASEALMNSQRLHDNNLCELIAEWLRIYSNHQEVMYFLCISIDSVCNLDSNRRRLCELNASSIILNSLLDNINGEGYITEALSALGSLYDGMLTGTCISYHMI